MSLHLVDSPAPPPPAFELPPLNLRRRATRPGASHLEISFASPASLTKAVRRIASEEGLPTEVWVGMAIESERAVEAARQADKGEELRGYLDDLAATPATPVPGGAGRLGEFARALRALGRDPRQGVGEVAGRGGGAELLTAKVPYQALTAWRRAAIEASEAFDAWAVGRLGRLPRRRLIWEAKAAEEGATLAEWVLLYAARR
jgi:hypothetical protein